MSISRDHRAARNQASINMADAGPAASAVKLYAAQGGTLLATHTLAKPCGAITVDGRIQLLPAATTELVTTTGAPTWGEWCNGYGVPIWGADVTDEAGTGPFKLAGTGSMILYAGGVVTLSTPALLG